MSTQVNYQVCGVSAEGYGWHEPRLYPTFAEADEQAEHWAKHEPEVWVEKVTTTREIVRSISSALPTKALIPA